VTRRMGEWALRSDGTYGTNGTNETGPISSMSLIGLPVLGTPGTYPCS
jgi:hypothetical protein